MALVAGTRLGPYEILSPLGAGGMGEVYRARDTRLRRDVAIKVLPRDLSSDSEAIVRFERETRAIAALSHPNILAIHDVGPDGIVTFAVTELLEGETLRQRLSREILSESKFLDIGSALADGLSAAHAKGIIHRDLKPENVFLTSEGRVKILDFGLARQNVLPLIDAASAAATAEAATTPGAIMGTIGYMSPEQIRAGVVDSRTDIFALGCVLYEMATGRRPFARATAAETMAAIRRDPPEPASPTGRRLSPGVERVIRRCLEKNPDERFQSARDLAFALREIASGPVGFGDAAPFAPARPDRARQVRWATLAALVLLSGAITGTWLIWRAARRPAVRALAVLPFENLAGDPTQSSLADAMTESLITNLGRASALRVIARGAVVDLTKDRAPITKVGRSLGVDALVTGAVQKSGDQLRVNVQVVDVATGTQLWSAPFVQAGGNLFGLQDRVSRAVLSVLKVPLTAAEEKSLRAVPTSSLEAYEFYVRGKLHVRHENPEDNGIAIAELEKAVALDPAFAAAYAELAHAYGLKVFYFTPGDRAVAEKAAVACEKALSLDPELAEAHYAKAFLLWTPANRFPHEQAMAEYHQALALDPNNDDAHHQLGLIEAHIGLLEAAAGEFRTALAIDPTNTLARHRMGVALLYQLRHAEALSVFRETPRDFNPSLWTYHVGWALLYLGRREESAATLSEFRKLEGKDRGGVVASVEAIAAAISGDAASAERAIASSIETGKGFGHFHHAAYDIGSAYALLGRSSDAVRWLRTSAENGFPCYPLFAKDPNLDRVRGDALFAAFLEQLRTEWEKRRALAA